MGRDLNAESATYIIFFLLEKKKVPRAGMCTLMAYEFLWLMSLIFKKAPGRLERGSKWR